jgi:hypothetical protein
VVRIGDETADRGGHADGLGVLRQQNDCPLPKPSLGGMNGFPPARSNVQLVNDMADCTLT